MACCGSTVRADTVCVFPDCSALGLACTCRLPSAAGRNVKCSTVCPYTKSISWQSSQWACLKVRRCWQRNRSETPAAKRSSISLSRLRYVSEKRTWCACVDVDDTFLKPRSRHEQHIALAIVMSQMSLTHVPDLETACSARRACQCFLQA